MTKIAGLVLLLISAVTFLSGVLFLNERWYRGFLVGYMKFFGVDATKLPKTSAIPDPIKPHVIQAKIAGYIFIALAVYICLSGMYLLSIS